MECKNLFFGIVAREGIGKGAFPLEKPKMHKYDIHFIRTIYPVTICKHSLNEMREL